jgi:hypothetical protein
MKIIVTHISPDLDAIASVWLIKRFLPGWQDAKVEFVQAGDRLRDKIKNQKSKIENEKLDEAIEESEGDEIIHVDTGLGCLDHHQLQTEEESAASLTWRYVKKFQKDGENLEFKKEAIERMVQVIVDIDHFKEVFWEDPASDRYDFCLVGLLDGLKLEKPNDDSFYVEFGIISLDAILHEMENKVWAEKEIAEKGIKFETRFGKGIAIETINDTVIKLSQKMGYQIAVRKDPRKGYVRIKALPNKDKDLKADLTLAYEQLKKMDTEATWFLHINKKMLLNGTPKNPKMKPTKLSLSDIIETLKSIYG